MGGVFKVGVFDSGIGGLTVLSECVKLMPENCYIYLGDNFRAPYGSRSPQEISRYVDRALVSFYKLQTDAVVLACNTATAVCAEQMRARYGFPIIGTEPAIKPAARQGGRILVLSTPRTAESERLHSLIEKYSDCRITVSAQPDLAAAIEDAVVKGKSFQLQDYLPCGEYDGIVLGCTHYVFFKKEISEFYSAPVFDGGEGTARQLKSVLENYRNEKSLLNLGMNDHFLGGEEVNKQKTNNCSEYLRKKGKIRAFSGINFIGNAKKINKTVYEQMFI